MASLSEVLKRKQANRNKNKDIKVVNDLAETKIRLRKLKELEVIDPLTKTRNLGLIFNHLCRRKEKLKRRKFENS
jgi:hypothetical protein